MTIEESYFIGSALLLQCKAQDNILERDSYSTGAFSREFSHLAELSLKGQVFVRVIHSLLRTGAVF